MTVAVVSMLSAVIPAGQSSVSVVVTPTDDNVRQTQKLKARGIFSEVHTEIGQIIVLDARSGKIASAERCRQCHGAIYDTYAKSVHGSVPLYFPTAQAL